MQDIDDMNQLRKTASRNYFSARTNNAIDAAQRENLVRAIESGRAQGQTAEQIATEFGVKLETVSAYFIAVDLLIEEVHKSETERFDQI